jgi:pentatricopeptide repeat protein
MFACNECFRHTVRGIISDLPTTNSSPLLRQHTNGPLSFLYPRQSRNHSTVQAIRKGHHRQVLKKALNEKKPLVPNNSRRRNGPLPGEVRDLLARENNRKHLSIEDNQTSASTQFQLQWLEDPLKLANAVVDRLRVGADQSALELIRGSEKQIYIDGEKQGRQIENVVSWNHVMEYYMHKGDTREALKVYNEMKKRGHRPEAQTYTIMLKGFAINIKQPNAVANAVSVYNSIFAPNSTVKPNTIHTNAVINVCARGGDMSNLWAIAGRLPDRGMGAADHVTYTNIINAIRADAERRSQEEEDRSDKIITDAIQDGEKLWVDVNKRCRAGDLLIDEALTCAMGRLLLLSKNEAHHNSVFSLVEQTMRIRTCEAYRKVESNNEIEETSQTSEGVDMENQPRNSTEVANFEPITSKANNIVKQMSTHAKPSNNTLSMLIQACILTRNLPAGKYYWNLLTSKDGQISISYDPENFAQYLRLLRISRSSKAVRDLFSEALQEKKPDEFFVRGNFVIAMSTCLRDKNNPNVFENATDIFEMMQAHLHHVDAKVMEMYLEVAIVVTPGLGFTAGRFEPNPSRNNVMRVLARLEDFVPELQDMILSKVREEQYEELPRKRRKKLSDPREQPDRVYQSKSVLTSFMTALISAYDRVLAQGSLPTNIRERYMLRKRRMHTFIAKMNPLGAGRRTMTTYSERERGAEELDNQEKEFDDRARGIKMPIRYHPFTDPRDQELDPNEGRYPPHSRIRYDKPTSSRFGFSKSLPTRRQASFQEGMGSDFASLARQQGRGDGDGFVHLGS